MKIKNAIITLTCLLLLNSCIIKSLQPFYTKNAIDFQDSFIGEWKDNKEGYWKVISFKNEAKKENFFDEDIPPKEMLEFYKAYKDSYIVTYTKKEIATSFIVIPFKVNDEFFLDFTPFNDSLGGINSLLNNHLLATHSLAKFEVIDNKNISVSWLSESRIEELLEQNQIRIKHERIGVTKDLVLTASSEELMSFVEKYSKSTIKDKWESSSKHNLKKIDVKS